MVVYTVEHVQYISNVIKKMHHGMLMDRVEEKKARMEAFEAISRTGIPMPADQTPEQRLAIIQITADSYSMSLTTLGTRILEYAQESEYIEVPNGTIDIILGEPIVQGDTVVHIVQNGFNWFYLRGNLDTHRGINYFWNIPRGGNLLNPHINIPINIKNTVRLLPGVTLKVGKAL